VLVSVLVSVMKLDFVLHVSLGSVDALVLHVSLERARYLCIIIR
jgi:hypothetical protein